MKRNLILPALLLLAACGSTPTEDFAQAKNAYAQHSYRTARVLLASVLAEKPTDKTVLLLQARTLIALGDGDGAGSAISQITGPKPPTGELAELAAEASLLRKAPDVALTILGDRTSAEAHRLRALATIQKGDFSGAAGHFEKAVAAGGNPRALADFARLKLLTGDRAGAMKLLAQAERAAPDGLDTLLIGGQIAVGRGDLARALTRYDRAGKLFPDSLAALTGKAATLGDLGRIDEMEQAVKAAAGFAPNDPTVIYLQARAAIARKDWATARDVIQRAEATLPQLDPARVLYAEALLNLRQPELATAQLGPIVRSQPSNRAALTLLAEAQMASGNSAAALATMRLVIADPAIRPEELALIAKIAKAAGDPRVADFAAKAARPAPQALIADLSEADAAIRAKDWARAVVAYNRVLAVTDGRNPLVLNNMAYAQLMTGNLARARMFADRAVKEAPENASVLDTAGWVRVRSGKDLAEAKRLLRLAAEKAPDNATIRAHLAEVQSVPG